MGSAPNTPASPNGTSWDNGGSSFGNYNTSLAQALANGGTSSGAPAPSPGGGFPGLSQQNQLAQLGGSSWDGALGPSPTDAAPTGPTPQLDFGGILDKMRADPAYMAATHPDGSNIGYANASDMPNLPPGLGATLDRMDSQMMRMAGGQYSPTPGSGPAPTALNSPGLPYNLGSPAGPYPALPANMQSVMQGTPGAPGGPPLSGDASQQAAQRPPGYGIGPGWPIR